METSHAVLIGDGNRPRHDIPPGEQQYKQKGQTPSMHTDRARVAITGEEPPTCTHTFTQRQEQELEGEKEMGGPNDQDDYI